MKWVKRNNLVTYGRGIVPLATTKTFMPNADWRPQGLASISHKHFANGPGPDLHNLVTTLNENERATIPLGLRV